MVRLFSVSKLVCKVPNHYFRDSAINYRDYWLSMIINNQYLSYYSEGSLIWAAWQILPTLPAGGGHDSAFLFAICIDFLFLLPSQTSSVLTFLLGETVKNLLALFCMAISLSCVDVFHVTGIWKWSSWPLISTPVGLAHHSISCENSAFTTGSCRTISLKPGWLC